MSERPAAILGFVLLISVSAASFISATVGAVLAALLLAVAAVIAIFLRRNCAKTVMAVLATVAVGLVLFSARYTFFVAPLSPLKGTIANVSAELCQAPTVYSDRYFYVARCSSIDCDVSTGFKFSISSSRDLGLRCGDTFDATVTFTDVDRSPDGVYPSAYINSYNSPLLTVTGHRTGLNTLIADMRESMLSAVSSYAPGDEGQLISAVTLGETGGMSNELYDSIERCGMTHMAVVSGAHLAIIVGYVMRLTARLGRRRSAAVCIPFVVLIMALVGFSPSIVRAGITTLIYLLGILLLRKGDGISSLAIAIIIMLVCDPFCVLSKGFMLSVFSTAGIILLTDPIIARMPKRPRCFSGLYTAFAVTLSAQLITLPLSLSYFGRLSVFSVLANVILYYPLNLVIVFGMLASVFSFIPYIGTVVILPAVWLSKLCISVFRLIGGSSIAVANVFGDAAFIMLAVLLVLSAAFIIFRGRRARTANLSAALAAVILLGTVSVYSHTVAVRITAVDTDMGMNVVVSYRGHAAIISCPYDDEVGRLVGAVSKLNAPTVDMLILPDSSTPFDSATEYLIERINPSEVMCAAQYNRSGKRISERLPLEASAFTLWDCVRLTVLPDVGVRIEANGSAVAVSIARVPSQLGQHDILFTRLGNVSTSASTAVFCRHSHARYEAGYLADSLEQIYLTEGQGSITATLYSQQNIIFRRERDGGAQ